MKSHRTEEFLSGLAKPGHYVVMKEARDEFDAAAQRILGEDLYAQFQLHERQRPTWDYVRNHGNAMSLVDIPLSMEQATRLTDAIANANASYQKGNVANMLSATTDWNAVDAAASEFLTPEQLVFFETLM